MCTPRLLVLVPASQTSPSNALEVRLWAKGRDFCARFRQAEVVPQQHPKRRGWSPAPALSLAQRQWYNNREIIAGPGLCLHSRAAAGSDYAATMFCSINIMSSLNLY